MSDTLAHQIAGEVTPLVTEALQSRLLTTEQVQSIVIAATKKLRPSFQRVQVTLPSGEIKDMGRQHPLFGTLLRIVATGIPVWIAGPAGSGKTTAAEQVARALNLDFGAISIGLNTTESKFFGYKDAMGVYHTTLVRERHEHGGVILIDEIDRGNPGVLTSLNQYLGNGTTAFPDGMVPRHANRRVVATANTYGMGANRVYVGALQVDGATLDRFVTLEWPYDEAFELDLALACASAELVIPWVQRVQALRHATDALGIRHIISPRASINGSLLLAAGLKQAEVEDMSIWKGLDTDSRKKIESNA